KDQSDPEQYDIRNRRAVAGIRRYPGPETSCERILRTLHPHRTTCRCRTLCSPLRQPGAPHTPTPCEMHFVATAEHKSQKKTKPGLPPPRCQTSSRTGSRTPVET